ncbi:MULTISPECIES: protoporphyrinogen/coproporphyrinogen oxidase [Massilia]|uniref:NAD(P)-binding protein n=2 Tax=Massilia TaxID=149698 RepID=A0A7X3K5P4_9BURK|nr:MULTISPECIES: FAD-dependent oxidoreductase [Telluria group]KQY08689.1 O-antigen biosynthesis protein [Massilia sp. Root133]KQZ54285.1 O-antigen biosynthesis protein [Massilia sp. Root1485]MDN4046078.1 FAD-dependent oxidoreductase [Massilia sp. YIM B02787]MVW58370.1 NAD(P)-binding protein [Telluria cellulosilytica]
METIDIVILGAGIAGLGAALRARELNRQAVVFEARDRAGGLLDNFTVDGFRFDHAVHLSFANEPEVRAIFDRTPYLTHPADSYCWDDGYWLKHPVQNNLYPLPPEQRVALIKSFLARPDTLAHDDYESWLRHQYGDAIAERYPLRYTQKYWAVPARALSTTWIGNRMRRAELDEILFGALTGDTPNTYYTKEMRYPVAGGYKAFIQPLLDAAEIRTGHAATGIDTAARTVTFANGATVRYRQLVSTLPLPVLVRLAGDVPDDVRAAGAGLHATSIDLVSVGFDKPLVKDLWFYIYDEDIVASRAYSPSVKSPDNAPPGCSSLQFEIYNYDTGSAHAPDALKENTVYALRKMGIATADDIVVLDHRRLAYGNVIFEQGMEERRARVRGWADAAGIATCGRFGEWDYLWSNQSLLSGYRALP